MNNIGEKPEFTENQKTEIREKTAHRIYKGKGIAHCSVCGVFIYDSGGDQVKCVNCGSKFNQGIYDPTI